MEHSKGQVDRAGQVLAKFFAAALHRDTDTVEDLLGTDVATAWNVVKWWRGTHARPLSRVAANLRYYADQHGTPTVAQRLKKLPTIADKLLRQPTMRLSRMGDIGGVRAVLPDQGAVHGVATRLRKNWTITGFRDYVANPKPDGYRALHLYNRHHGRLIEVQLRTPHQDQWANAVESDARQFDLGLKSGGGPAPLHNFYLALGDAFAVLGQGGVPDQELLERVESLRRDADTFRSERKPR